MVSAAYFAHPSNSNKIGKPEKNKMKNKQNK